VTGKAHKEDENGGAYLPEKRMKHTFRMFTKIARTWSAFLAVVATVGITNISAARADATDAKNLLKAMSDYLAAQKTISFDYDVDLELVSTTAKDSAGEFRLAASVSAASMTPGI
jgi:hypothetical protein